MSAKPAVIDTNVLVSAVINPNGAPARVVASIQHGSLKPILSAEVFAEYQDVLARPHFNFPADKVHDIVALFEHDGLLLQPPPVDTAGLPDPGDAPFVALARHAQCPLITGNTRHFPAKLGLRVMTAREWLEVNAER